MTLEEFRRQEGLTYDDLAALLQIGGKNPARTVQRYSTHERIPPWPVLRTLERVSKGRVTRSDFPDKAVVRFPKARVNPAPVGSQ